MTFPRISLVGEAWGQNEADLAHPFVGASGRELAKMLQEADILPPGPVPYDNPRAMREFWLTQSTVSLHNVVNARPDRNDFDNFCASKAGDQLGLPYVRTGKYLRSEYRPHLERLSIELAALAPNLIVALGGTAAWALLNGAAGGITRIRGAITSSSGVVGQPSWLAPIKVLPTFHPAAILREWSNRPTTVFDLRKARREADYPDIRRPARRVYVEPDLSDLDWFMDEHLRPARTIAIDIETLGSSITCIGFAPDPEHALVVPFVDRRPTGHRGSYWPDRESEKQAWTWVGSAAALPARKIFQNGLFDLGFLWRHGIVVANAEEDTMLLHHALYPESKKGLGFLGSVYTDEASWKLMNRKVETIKRDN